jgi:hypothetical protein
MDMFSVLFKCCVIYVVVDILASIGVIGYVVIKKGSFSLAFTGFRTFLGI